MSIQDEINRLNQEIKRNQELLNDPELTSLAQKEIESLKAQKNALKQALDIPATSTNTSATSPANLDQTNAILEIRPAAGGDEAKIWASDLLRMYLRYCEKKGFKIQHLNDYVIKIIAKNAYQTFKFENGVHRVQRVPITESQGRIHTSTATVAILPEIPASAIKISPNDLEWQFFRSSGHGGQNVNKLSTAVRLTHQPSGITIKCEQERHQQQNKQIALAMLRARLWQQKEEKRQEKIKKQRRQAVGRGMRSEKIRTYNFPQNRVTDHRLNKSWHNLESILDGNLDPITKELH